MSSLRVPTIGDRGPRRTAWADLADSSQECSKDEALRAPLVDHSYETKAAGVEDGLNSRLSRTAVNEAAQISGPLNFAWLAQPAASSDNGSLNASAPVFFPSTSATASSGPQRKSPSPDSPDMPPPAVPQATAKKSRIRGKRPVGMSTIQEPAVKRTREQERPTSSMPEPPPPATEEEWHHRIAKRLKVVTAIKESVEYQGYSDRRNPADRLDGEPRTPTAEDRLLSKRRWEYEIQQWRNQLKLWCAANGLPVSSKDKVPDDVSMQVIEEHSPDAAEEGQ